MAPITNPSPPGRNSHKTPVSINVYDLLPPGKISSLLWFMGCGLLHTGVVVNNREYAFGGHDKKGVTGVYWMKPRTEPPGGTFRCEILHGFSFGTEEEINRMILEASEEFLGPTYNLLTRNCNHFTSFLCEKLTGKSAPRYINRAAGIGVTLPCIVPAEWVEPPECEEPIDGVEEEEERLVDGGSQGSEDNNSDYESSGDEWGESTAQASEVHSEEYQLKDTQGHRLPQDERAPVRT